MLRVIVADDEEKVAGLICRLVNWEELGMEVAGVAHNGLHALELVKTHRPDILITDIRMPGCDGLELIRKAKEIFPLLSIVIISGHPQFDYAQTAIRYGVSNYLLKPIQQEELRLTLEKLRQAHQNRARVQALPGHGGEAAGRRLRAGLFERLQQGSLPAELGPINREYGYQMQEGCFQLALIKADGDYASLSGEGLDILSGKMDSIVREAMAGCCQEMELAFGGTTARLLLNYAPEAAGGVRKGLHKALEELRQQNSFFPSVVFTIALGSVHGSLSSLWESALAAQAALEGRLLGGVGTLLEPEEEPAPSAEKRSAFVAGAGRQLRRKMELMDPAALCLALDEMGEELLAEPAFTGADILAVAHEICHSYLWLAREMGLGLPDAQDLYRDYLRKEDVCATAREVLACLREALLESFTGAVQRQQEADSRPILAAKQHIAAHYMQPLTLEDVAAEAGFNASYFSTLFKKETGQSFTEHLTAVRIDKAKELLRDTNEPMAAICEQVGYLDRKHFAATFRKLTGVKPGEFRKLYS